MLSCGIVGLPNVGKSTLFNALLKKQQALVANYPFATIEPNVGVVPVPDYRLERLADLVAGESKPDGFADDAKLTRRVGQRPPIVPALIKFVDIAGLVKGASLGEGLGNQFLSHIREVDAIAEVVRNFSDENVIRAGSINPESDIEVINTELILADLESTQKLKVKNQNDKSKVKNLVTEAKNSTLDKIEVGLNQGKLAREVVLTEEEKETVKELQLLTSKPFIYVFNSDEGRMAELSSVAAGGTIGGVTGDVIYVSAKLEAEISALSGGEQKEFLKELGIKESGLDKVVRAAFSSLSLINYFTAGPKEVRAWTIVRGDRAPRAAGKIHTDFERGFIAAEVISTEELLSVGSYKKAKELGKIRLEGKGYEVKDGDVIEFRFSV